MRKFSLAVGTLAIAVGATFALAHPPGNGYGAGAGCAAAGDATATTACPMAGGGPGQGMGYGQGMGPGAGMGYGHGAGMGPGRGAGYGRGGGMGPGGGQALALLTPEERTAHREAMHNLKSVEECTAYVAQQRELITERAKEKGVAVPFGPRGDMCERMQAHGMFG